MIRKYKSWSGLALLNMLGMIGIYCLIVLLISSFMDSWNMLSLIIIILIVLVAGLAYINYITLLLKNRLKEFYLRKLLGAGDNQLMSQLLLESLILSTFLVISGIVLANFISPWCGEIIGVALAVSSMSFFTQLAVVIILVIAIGLLGAVFPIRAFINYVKNNFSKLSHRPY